ncbi:GGDEF-domain containing protein [Mycolicibacterium madagascariense]|uniref:GGDEF-domain containing protein n=1 Tax=Mycolicibacterium madagascariense TaxID=212765 RepID=A0A7I7XAL6_9MYCO|nr:EAL domain-containing protein [Mycolicibacterium madagascariense]MCV7015059.1 EAL domain-containing protein [Mycolicibacterium madagascariense]BBZ25947.1 GGDEF-domain containing protein [Mycolicibacterium madagascariense]
MTRARLSGITVVVTTLFVVFAAWLGGDWGGPRTLGVVSDVGSVAAGGFAVTSAAVAARASRGRQRRAWAALTVAALGWLFGDVVWAFQELVLKVDAAPFPSASDAGYLMFPVAACVALMLLPIGSAGLSQTRLVLDGIIVAASLFVIIWANGLNDVFTVNRDSLFAFALSVAYPISDVILLTVALLMLTRARTGQRAVMSVFCLAIALMLVSDGAFALLRARDAYASGNVIDVGWTAGLLLLGLASLIGLRSNDIEFGLARAPSRASLWIIYLPLPAATVYMVISPASTPLLVAALVLVFGVLARQFIVADENRSLLVAVAEQAFRDPLTGLANRALFLDRLTHATAMQIRDGRTVSVLSIDLDDFKLVNDSLGHPAGDALLVDAAERIGTCVAAGDTVARLGGDEFAVLVEDGATAPLVIGDRLVDVFDAPFVVDGHEVHVRPSIGVASRAPGDVVDDGPESLLKHADLAMYSAKRSQHGGVHAYTADMHLIDVSEVDPPRDREAKAKRYGSAGLQLFAQLRRAIDEAELTLVYQPKFDVATGRLAGVEALVRWEHPERGLLLPDDFLPLARQNGLMGALTEAVMRRAVDDAGAWRARGVDIPFAVNLFPPSLGDLELPDRIAGILADGGLNTECLTVEITEDFLVGNIRRAREVLVHMRRLGIRIAIDDFGSGYSALSYLRDLPIDELKLDREFIAPILDDERAEAIVRAVIDLTHRLGMICVAEGVENAATAARLATYGCDLVQGYHCGPPVEAAQVPDIRPLLPAGVVVPGRRG